MNLVIGVVLVLGVMILVHELGHFVAAKWCGVRVERFSIGYPPRLWGVRYKGTDYCISALPFGGYVRMAGQDLSDVDRGDDVPSGKPDELLSKPRWQRAIIAFAGPAMNLILPVILMAAFFMVKGQPYLAYLDQPVQVQWPVAGAESPLEAGDRVRALNGVTNPTWKNVETEVLKAEPGSTLHLDVEHNGARRSVDVPVKDAAQALRVFGYEPLPPAIEEVAPGMPADRAGIRANDEIVSLNGQRIWTWPQFVDLVKASGGKRLQVKVLRRGQEITAEVDPQQNTNDRGEAVWMVGIQAKVTYRPVSPGQAVEFAALYTTARIEDVIGIVGKLLTGRVSVKQLQGVVGIARVSGQAVQRGPSSVLELMAFISINLGILNLLPIPILDGGHILLLAIEGTMRRDLSLAFKERFVQVGFVFLLVLFGIVMYNDVVRLLPLH